MSSILFKLVAVGAIATAVTYFKLDRSLAEQIGGATGLTAFGALLAKFWGD